MDSEVPVRTKPVRFVFVILHYYVVCPAHIIRPARGTYLHNYEYVRIMYNVPFDSKYVGDSSLLEVLKSHFAIAVLTRTRHYCCGAGIYLPNAHNKLFAAGS
jgi:hypothetical protein